MKLLILCIWGFTTLVIANGGEVSDSKDGKSKSELMQKVWNDIINENYFDMNRVLNLYDYKDSKSCPKDLGNDIEEIVGKIQQINLALNEINLDVRKETNFVLPLVRNLSMGAKSTSPIIQKCVSSAKTLFDAYHNYKSNMLFCYDTCKPHFKAISEEVNQLMAELAEVINKGNDLNPASIQHKKQNVDKLITKINDFRGFMNLFMKCTEKAMTIFQKVQNEFNTIMSTVNLTSRL
ncbi:uncharacterized protein LOC116341465 [Contarinia nasturtii]|uniref:uncharacterized protein LOC116341465 n=1 Tax=Contarinia nasturtii TaxID=265458 RepID=UPI0012D433A4|nr:uncharacterized protein LOC116341465 [Contarinia nasturtii]